VGIARINSQEKGTKLRKKNVSWGFKIQNGSWEKKKKKKKSSQKSDRGEKGGLPIQKKNNAKQDWEDPGGGGNQDFCR